MMTKTPIVFRVLAKLLPTSNVTALVEFLSTFAAKLAAAEQEQIQAADGYSAQINELAQRREEALEVARKAANVRKKLNDLVS